MATMKNTWAPEPLRELREYLQEKYGATMSVKEIGEEVNLKDRIAITTFMGDVKCGYVGRKILYRTGDVARRIYDAVEVGV